MAERMAPARAPISGAVALPSVTLQPLGLDTAELAWSGLLWPGLPCLGLAFTGSQAGERNLSSVRWLRAGVVRELALLPLLGNVN